MAETTIQADLQLDFLVVGAGIAGLSTAYALARSGHRVHILERYSSLDDYPAVGGVRLPPNAAKILIDWGFTPEIDNEAHAIQGSTMLSMYTGEVVGYVNWLEVVKELKGRFVLMSHSQLHRILYHGCIAAGVQISFGVTVMAVTANADVATVTLVSGEELHADMIIGADGTRSIVREAISDFGHNAKRSGISGYTGLVPMDAVVADEELQKLMIPTKNGMDWMIFMGSNRFMLSYPAGNDGYTVHIYWPDSELPEAGDDEDETWCHKVSPSLIPIDDFCPLVQRLVKKLPSMVRVSYMVREVEEWMDETSRILLIGEAAHTLFPAGTYNTSTSLEDAALLGTLYSRLRSWDQIHSLSEAYQELRQKRVQYMIRAETNNFHLVTAPTGPEQEARDAHMREQYALSRDPSNVTDDMLLEQWEAIADVYAYSPVEEADNWWMEWGILRERASNRPGHTSMEMTYASVSTTVDKSTT